MTTRKRFHTVMDFEPFDRLPVVEWAPWWDQTLDRWHKEGLPPDLQGPEIDRFFGLDIYRQYWFASLGPSCPRPPHYGAGIIETMGDYERILPQLYPPPALDAEHWQAAALSRQAGEEVVWFTLDGFFWFPRTLLGIERHLYTFYDDPKLMHRINSDLADFHVRIIEAVCEIAVPDFITFAEDLSYNHGPMLSKDLFEEFLTPYYRKVIPHLKSRGIIPIADSDGNVTAAAGWFEAAGIDGILPLERQSGVDVAQLRRTHPRMQFIGAFDKMAMNRGEAAMRAEFERLLPTAAAGGLIISCDHQTPPGVSLEEYRLYLALFREYAAKAGALSRNRASTDVNTPAVTRQQSSQQREHKNVQG